MTITRLTITNGSGSVGGGILNSGTMIVNGSRVSGNSASEGGGIHNVGTFALR